MSWKMHRAPGVEKGLVETLLTLPGEVISGRAGNVQVVRLEHAGNTYFRKQVSAESSLHILGRWFRFGHWGTLPELEAKNLQQLKKRGFSVIDVLASGARYHAAFPVAGFMLSAATPGTSLEEKLLETTSPGQSRLARVYGSLAGRLNKAGGYEALRAKDVQISLDNQLILLDREKPLVRGGWQVRRAAKSLQRAWFRNRRSGLVLNDSLMEAFWEGYREGAGLDKDTLAALRNAVIKRQSLRG